MFLKGDPLDLLRLFCILIYRDCPRWRLQPFKSARHDSISERVLVVELSIIRRFMVFGKQLITKGRILHGLHARIFKTPESQCAERNATYPLAKQTNRDTFTTRSSQWSCPKHPDCVQMFASPIRATPINTNFVLRFDIR